MTRIIYFDCFSGISGDMLLGALIDVGLDADELRTELSKLNVDGWSLGVSHRLVNSIRTTRVTVNLEGNQKQHRHLGDIEQLLSAAKISAHTRDLIYATFRRLAEAEAKVHGVTLEQVHFHEVGAVDAIIDIAGVAIGMELLGIEHIVSSPLPMGRGFVDCEHGRLPLPAPATLELLVGKPVISMDVEGELVTPTGAAMAVTLANSFGPPPPMIIQRVGYGAGKQEFAHPNLLRVWLGDAVSYPQPLAQMPVPPAGAETDVIVVLEANLDDMSPQLMGHAIASLLEAGALDVFAVPVHMKKDRPATILTVICEPVLAGPLSEWLLRETTSIGVRYRLQPRIKAPRSVHWVSVRGHEIRVKVTRLGTPAEIVNVSTEYDDCRRAALALGLPLKQVMDEARMAAFATIG